MSPNVPPPPPPEQPEVFEVEAIVGTRVSQGKKAGDAGRKGEILYRIVWKGYLPEAATWEPAQNIHDELLDEYEASLEAEAELDAEEERELAVEAAREAAAMPMDTSA